MTIEQEQSKLLKIIAKLLAIIATQTLRPHEYNEQMNRALAQAIAELNEYIDETI